LNFRTNIQLQKEHNQIDYNANLLLIGSCFSENIYHKLEYFKFRASSNPFGILYNPMAIETLIANVINEKEYAEKDIFELNNSWHCFDAHSNCSANTKEDILTRLNTKISSTKKQLNKASHLIITLGTARVYRHIKSDSIVGNCHKIPQKQFQQELRSVKQIITSLKNSIELVKSQNPSINIIFTVSPIRHLKDGFVENMQSKSHLVAAIHQVIDKRKQVYYFPSYEIMMDDLRDYRFYNEDMIHPNQQAINYIWEQFKLVWINENTTSIMNEVDAIQKGLKHKPFNPNSEKHQLFLKNLQLKILKLKKDFKIQL
jgi:lysophospholipase L1-like esterase